MGLSCGLVGLSSCGKTVIVKAITAVGASSYDSSEMSKVVINIPDQRINKLVDMYHPQKTVPATLDVVDIPGLKKGEKHRLRLLGHIKDVEALLHVVRCFEDENVPFEHDGIDPVWDVDTINLELMTADSNTLLNKVNRLAKKVRSGDKDVVREVSACEKVYAAIQEGIPARKLDLNAQELASIRECNLVSLKPVLYIANIKSMEDAGDNHVTALRAIAQSEGTEMITICGKDEADITQFGISEQQEFLKDLGLKESSVERLLLAAYRLLGLINFFTVGEDEVRAWTCRKGEKSPVAAGKIHSDMETGFIRMEVMSYEDLMELGSEANVAKAGKQRIEGREYEVQDGDIVSVRFNRKG